MLGKLLQVISVDTRAQMQHTRLNPFRMVYETRFLHIEICSVVSNKVFCVVFSVLICSYWGFLDEYFVDSY